MNRYRSASDQVERGLIRRLRIYLAIFAVAVVVTIVDVIQQGASAVLAVVVCLVAGVVGGVLASTVSRLSWDKAANKVVGRIDALGLVVLVCYVLLVVFKKRLLADWFAPSLVGVAGVAVLAGLMLGQAIGTAGGVARVLHTALSGPRPGPG